MDLSTITVADFKAFFYRDFPYLPVWSVSQLYNQGARVYYPVTLLFYQCQTDGTIGTVPANVTPWLKVADDINNYVQDGDISKAFLEAQAVFNQGLFGSDANITQAYLYLTAHYLVNDLRAAAAGMAGTGAFPVSSRTVGSVSESYGIPDAYKESPIYSFYTQSAYGMKYLSLVLPNLVGNVVGICGWTHP